SVSADPQSLRLRVPDTIALYLPGLLRVWGDAGGSRVRLRDRHGAIVGRVARGGQYVSRVRRGRGAGGGVDGTAAARLLRNRGLAGGCARGPSARVERTGVLSLRRG